jgi:ubiquinone/menaquinone biosynthesis C-methylase UbiE
VGRLLALALLAVLGAALWWRKHPSACPYGQRFWVEAPHPLITRERLRAVLAPRDGERILEIGPGTGYYTLDLAAWVGTGAVEMLDLQQEMLDHTMARAGDRGISNLTPTLADATTLPYADASFDAVVLITTLGEIPDRESAIGEIARVLRPGGRLVVGELFGDPHFTTPGDVERLGRASGLLLDQRSGPWVGFFARLSRPAGDDGPAG